MRKLLILILLAGMLLAGCSGKSEALTTAPEGQQEPGIQTAVPEAAPEGKQVYTLIPGKSVASYEVGETFLNEGNRFAIAVGITSSVSGEVWLDPAHPDQARVGPVQVDISRLSSDSVRRDGFIQERFLESARFPIATFTPTAIEGLPESYQAGEEIQFQISGDLTVHEVTRPVTFSVIASLEDGVLTGSAESTILMSDFGVGPVEVAGILKTEDQVKLLLTFVASN
jgi:polyisoprenoid-binding protein YceI